MSARDVWTEKRTEGVVVDDDLYDEIKVLRQALYEISRSGDRISRSIANDALRGRS